MTLVTLDIADARFPQWRPNSLGVEPHMSRLRIVAVPSAHTEGMYLRLPHLDFCFRICKVISKTCIIVRFQFNEDSEAGKRTFAIHSLITISSIAAAKSPHAHLVLSLPVNSVSGTTDQLDVPYFQPSEACVPVASMGATIVITSHKS